MEFKPEAKVESSAINKTLETSEFRPELNSTKLVNALTEKLPNEYVLPIEEQGKIFVKALKDTYQHHDSSYVPAKHYMYIPERKLTPMERKLWSYTPKELVNVTYK